MEEELEIVIRPDGTKTVKVVSSKRDCKEVAKPFEKGKILKTESIPNPGQQDKTRLKGNS